LREGQGKTCPHFSLKGSENIAQMKKSAAGKNAKAKRVETIDAYLAAVSEPQRSTLEKIRATIRSAVPKETDEVISYGIPAFKYKKVLIWYAAFSDHCSLFPTASVIAKFKEELKGYKVSKGTIQFPVDKALRTTLLKKMVKARLAEIKGH
jgi:uncharacterized protein YdhG (YjbR/CyaY superfamily)